MGLIQYAPQSADRDLAFLWHDHSINHIAQSANKLDVASFLTGFHKPNSFKTTLDFAKGQRPKPPQPQPQSFALLEPV